jgi:hypothetical protein
VRRRIWLPALLLLQLSVFAREMSISPNWLTKPGIYELPDGSLLGVGQGKIPSSMRETRAETYSLDRAEWDAKERIARYLFPDIFKKRKTVHIGLKHVRRVSEKHIEDNSYVGIVVKPQDVTALPIPDTSVILEAEKVDVVPEMLLYLEDPLLQLGGGRIFARDEGWIALGVGLASLSGKGSLAEREALKLARVEANRALAETIFGSNMKILEREIDTALEKDGLVQFKKWSSTQTEETVSGQLRQAVEVGSWQTKDGYLASVMAVGFPALNLPDQAARVEAPVTVPDYPDWEVEARWEYVLLNYPRLLHGGAIIFPESDSLWIIGVGAAKLRGDPAYDRINAPRMAEMDARKNILKYLDGFSVKGVSKAVEELENIIRDNGAEYLNVQESLERIARENSVGISRNVNQVGSWKSEDRAILFCLFTIKLEEIASTHVRRQHYFLGQE